jgi:endonuclease/exonuclease/phosphatase (EEP) superfamily protein YafD
MEMSAPVVASLEILALACLVTTAAPWSRSTNWWVRVWDFPRPQQAVLAAAVAAALVGLARPSPTVYGLVVLLALAAAYHVAVILPYSPMWRPQLLPSPAPAGSRSLSLLIANVLMENRHADRLLALIREPDPDLVLAVETDEWWATRLGQLAGERPCAVAHPLANTYGMMLCSRLPLEAAEVRFLLQDEIPSIRAGVRLRSGDLVRFYAVHPEPPSPTEADTSLGRDAELVIIGREVARPTSLLSSRVISMTSAGRARANCSAACRNFWIRGSAVACSARFMPAGRSSAGLLTTCSSAPTFYRDIRRLPAFGSDHFPILIALDYAPRAVAAHEPPEPEHADLVEARETVAEAKAAIAAGSLGRAAPQLLWALSEAGPSGE